MKLKLVAALLVCGLAASISPVRADTVTVGPSSGADCTFLCTTTYQQAYASSVFSGPIDITSVSFIVSFDSGSLPTGTWQMSLSESANAVGSLSSTFTANIGPNSAVFDTETFSGTLAVGSLLTFSGSYNYDPASGPLLLTIQLVGGSTDNAARVVGVESGSDSPVYSRAFSFTSHTTADALPSNDGYYADTRTYLKIV